jgi:hypothetical protein
MGLMNSEKTNAERTHRLLNDMEERMKEMMGGKGGMVSFKELVHSIRDQFETTKLWDAFLAHGPLVDAATEDDKVGHTLMKALFFTAINLALDEVMQRIQDDPVAGARYLQQLHHEASLEVVASTLDLVNAREAILKHSTPMRDMTE